MKIISKKIKNYCTWASEIYPYFRAAYKHSRKLEKISDKTNLIEKNDILLFCTLKNECHRLEYFLNYYRKLGVNHFIFVDNNSTDNSRSFLEGQDDTTLFHTKDSYKESNFGMHWLNYLLFKYGRKHWCITCDPDEFIVYPHMDTRSIKDLTEYLTSIRQDSFFSVMVDMYSNLPISATKYEPGTSPLKVCPFFDQSGYSKQYNSGMRNQYIQGGVRKRVFSADAPQNAPALNKIPLVKWKWNYVYVSSMHMALPRRLNNCIDERKTTGALLHFKFINQLKNKVEEEMQAKQHYNNSAEYKQYDSILNNHGQLYHPTISTQFEDWKTLCRLGLINIGEW